MRGRIRALTILALSVLSGSAAADFQATMDALTKDLPADAKALVYRIVDCDHWTGEEPYDADRRAEIERAVAELACNSLPRDEAALRRRYAARPRVIEALDRAHKLSE